MKIKQLSIFLENQEGNMYSVLDTLAKNDINIKAVHIADISEFGILRLIVTDTERAEKILNEANFIVKVRDVIAVELDDTPGGLASVLKTIYNAKINLEYIYAFTHEKVNKAIVILQTENLDNLISVLEENNIPIIGSQDIYNL